MNQSPTYYFVDDVLLFFLRLEEEGGHYRDILYLYKIAKVMEINIHKSTLFFHELEERMVQTMKGIYPYQHSNFSGVGKIYMVQPIDMEKRTKLGYSL